MNGNLSSNPKKGVTLNYNILNRTDKIVFTGNSNYIRYTYDAGGGLLREEVFANSTSTTTTYDYIDGFVYENNNLSYFSMAEGGVRNNAGNDLLFPIKHAAYIEVYVQNPDIPFKGWHTVNLASMMSN